MFPPNRYDLRDAPQNVPPKGTGYGDARDVTVDVQDEHGNLNGPVISRTAEAASASCTHFSILRDK